MASHHLFFTVHRINRNVSGIGVVPESIIYRVCSQYSFEGKMKDGLISKLTITKTGHRLSRFKKIRDALPIYCADKNYSCLDEGLRTGRDKVEDDFMSVYSNPNQWSSTHHIQIAIVDSNVTDGVNAVYRKSIANLLESRESMPCFGNC